MDDQQHTVFLVDDDPSIRKSMPRALEKRGFHVETFDSSENFLTEFQADRSGCVVLDLSMPGMDGLELQQELVKRAINIPIIFITGHGGVPQSVQALKAGAIDFLEKPFRQETLVERINEAFEEDARRRDSSKKVANISARFVKLTSREHEVMRLLISEAANLSSKEIARKLSISPRTVDHHRARIMEKTQARSVSELVSLARQAGISQATTK